MDIRMPKLDGLEATRRLLSASVSRLPRVIVLTTFDRNVYVYEALKAGASGFLLKDSPPERLAAAIRVVAAGEALLARAITRRLIEEHVRGPRPGQAIPAELMELTERETARTSVASFAPDTASWRIPTRRAIRRRNEHSCQLPANGCASGSVRG